MNRRKYNQMTITYKMDGKMINGRYFPRTYFEETAAGLVEITSIDDIESIEAFMDDGSDNEDAAFRNHADRRFR